VTDSLDPRERARLVFDRFARLDPEGLTFVSLPTIDPADGKKLDAQVKAAGRSSGRSQLLAEAEREARDRVFTTFNQSAYRPQPFGLNWGQSLGPTSDRVAIARALRDAAAAAILEDVLPPEVLIDLRDPLEILALADQPGAANVLAGVRNRPTWVRAVLVVLVLTGPAAAAVAALMGAGLEVLAAAAASILILVALFRVKPKKP
jgi:hypothetical protein